MLAGTCISRNGACRNQEWITCSADSVRVALAVSNLLNASKRNRGTAETQTSSCGHQQVHGDEPREVALAPDQAKKRQSIAQVCCDVKAGAKSASKECENTVHKMRLVASTDCPGISTERFSSTGCWLGSCGWLG